MASPFSSEKLALYSRTLYRYKWMAHLAQSHLLTLSLIRWLHVCLLLQVLWFLVHHFYLFDCWLSSACRNLKVSFLRDSVCQFLTFFSSVTPKQCSSSRVPLPSPPPALPFLLCSSHWWAFVLLLNWKSCPYVIVTLCCMLSQTARVIIKWQGNNSTISLLLQLR